MAITAGSIGPLTETPRGKIIITATDYFSKWPEEVAVDSKNSEGVGKFLY